MRPPHSPGTARGRKASAGYTCVARLVQYHHKNQTGTDLAGLEHYLASDDRNRVIYHSRHVDIEVRTTEIVRDAEKLLGQCQNQDACSDIEAYQLLLRCIEEQTISENGIRRLRNKGTESPRATSLQNPTDPEATYSRKAGKQHIGYAANIVEAVGADGSVVVDYQYEQNTHSDSRFLTDHLKGLPAQNEESFIHRCRRCIFRPKPPGCRAGKECTAYQHKPQGDFGF